MRTTTTKQHKLYQELRKTTQGNKISQGLKLILGREINSGFGNFFTITVRFGTKNDTITGMQPEKLRKFELAISLFNIIYIRD